MFTPSASISMFLFEDTSVKSENMMSGVVITKEMEEEEKQLMAKGEKKEKEMMDKVCYSVIPLLPYYFFSFFSIVSNAGY